MKRSAATDGAVARNGENFTDLVYGQLKADILWGRLVPGAALRSDELRQRYAIGISPLREALTRLVSEQLVSRSPQRGFRVAEISAAEVRDVLDTRLIVEGEALRLSILHGGIAWESEIVVASHALTRAMQDGMLRPESEEWSKLHRRFHLSLIAGCRSPTLMHYATMLFDRAERHRMIGEGWRVQIESSGAVSGRNRVGEHESLSQMVLAQDFDGAMDVLRRHYSLTAQSVIHALEGDAAPATVTPVERVLPPRRLVARRGAA